MSRDVREALLDAAGAARDFPDVETIVRRGRTITWRRRGLKAAAAVVIVGVIAVGYRFDFFVAAPLPPAKKPPAVELRSLEGTKELRPGRYEVSEFEQPFNVRISGAGWFSGLVSPTWVYLTKGGWHLHVQRWDGVIASEGGSVRRPPSEPLPADLSTWFEENQSLDVLDLQPVSVAGQDGVRVDVAPVVDVARKYPECAGSRCVLVAKVADQGEFVDLAVGERGRFYILDMDGASVVIYWHARASRFQAIEPQFDGVVDSIRFQ